MAGSKQTRAANGQNEREPAGHPPILWGRHVLGRPGQQSHEGWLRAVMLPQLAARRLSLPRFDLPVLTEPSADAKVSGGYWLARCPFCAGCEGVWDEADWFYCCSCGNAAVAGQRIAVRFARRPAAIEAALADRPQHERHWDSTQTIADLKRAVSTKEPA